MATNNALNNLSESNSSTTKQTFKVSNTDNTGTAGAEVLISAGGSTTTGDPQVTFEIVGDTNWYIGVDNSTSNNFSIGNSTTVGSGEYLIVSTAGQLRTGSQSTFSAYLSAADVNVTGDGTLFTIGSGNPYTEVFDRHADFNNATGVFTAPTGGRYFFSGFVLVSGCTTNTGHEFKIITSNRNYSITNYRAAAATNFSAQNTVIADMDAADTCSIAILGSGEAGKTEDIAAGTAPMVTNFCGYLMP